MHFLELDLSACPAMAPRRAVKMSLLQALVLLTMGCPPCLWLDGIFSLFLIPLRLMILGVKHTDWSQQQMY